MPIKDAEIRPDGIKAEFEMVPGQLLTSLVNGVATLPQGRTDWKYDESLGKLTRVSLPDKYYHTFMEGIDFPFQPICVIKNGWNTVIQPSIGYDLQDSLSSSILINLRENVVEEVHFSNGTYSTPHYSVFFEPKNALPQGRVNGPWRSNAWLHIPVIHQISSFAPVYEGDENIARFDHVNNYAPAQVAMIFKDGHVPDLDVNKLMTRMLTLDHYKVQRIPLPELTFDKNSHYHVPNHSNTHLLLDEGNQTPLVKGKTISGIGITAQTELPYRVNVEVVDFNEHDCEYTNGPGRAVTIFAHTSIFDGAKSKSFDHKFLVHSNLAWLNGHLECVPGQAFAAAMPQLRSK